MVIPNNPPPQRKQGRSAKSSITPLYCIVGDTLCEIRIWSDEEWERLDSAARPSQFNHVPGLGWVGAVLGPTDLG